MEENGRRRDRRKTQGLERRCETEKVMKKNRSKQERTRKEWRKEEKVDN